MPSYYFLNVTYCKYFKNVLTLYTLSKSSFLRSVWSLLWAFILLGIKGNGVSNDQSFLFINLKKKFHKFAGDLVFMAAYKVRLGNFKKKKNKNV